MSGDNTATGMLRAVHAKLMLERFVRAIDAGEIHADSDVARCARELLRPSPLAPQLPESMFKTDLWRRLGSAVLSNEARIWRKP